MAVADNSTIGVPQTGQIPQIATGAGTQFIPTPQVPRPAYADPTDRSATPASLGSSLSAVVDTMMAAQPVDSPNITFGQQQPEIEFTYDQEASPPLDVYEWFAPSIFDDQPAGLRDYRD